MRTDADGKPEWTATDVTTEQGDPIDTFACDAPADVADHCGFTLHAGGMPCTSPSEAASLSCGVGTGEGPVLVRVCEARAVLGAGVACTYRDALANVVVDGDAVDVAFTCPARRDADEPGGRIALYRAPLFGGDATPDVSCTP